jgi:LytS/YehU family sensor histidine kinase
VILENLMKMTAVSQSTVIRPRTLLLALAFGLLGLLTLWGDLRVQVLPQYNIAGDVREIFVVLGAALTGPFGGALVGGISALYSPVSDPVLHFSSWLAHVLAGLSLGWVYQSVRKFSGWRFLLNWLTSVLTYYLILVATVLINLHLLAPAFLAQLAGAKALPWLGDYRMAVAVFPELLVVLFFTLIVMLALPIYYRRPALGSLPRSQSRGVDKSPTL